MFNIIVKYLSSCIAAQPRQREDDMPSFSLGISPPASQPTQPSEPSVSHLEILEEAVVDAGVTAALKFAEATTSELTLPTAEVFKTPEKKIKISKELIEKCYHWMTHVKKTKHSSNEYDTIFVLKHEALYEELIEYFMSLMPKEQVHGTVVSIHSMILNQIKVRLYQEQIYILPLDIVNFMVGTHGVDYTDKRTKKAYWFDIEQYAHPRQFLDKRKLALHPFLFVPICNGGNWWLWIADVKKKAFYMLDPVNKPKKDIPESRMKLNKFVGLIIPDEGLRWGGTLNGGRTSRRSRVYPTECYDCGIYVMKWLETIDPQKIKSGKRYKYKAWTQEEIDGFRYDYGPHILLHEMNKIRDQVIRASEAIRLPKSSAALSSPYCKFSSGDLDSK
ncbi:hypothetical protein Ahy_B05g076031 [Arachis hypogaea]|uniref:Ubiquitin-like protease family profile domain-containing protein n=1 Tax=Arachis hypogaea TaxID=3818 RepID=A0A444Z2E8_ARAHY|nr:hypothetical protein Ahy_B05g076031 [Arachis hypogaea]